MEDKEDIHIYCTRYIYIFNTTDLITKLNVFLLDYLKIVIYMENLIIFGAANQRDIQRRGIYSRLIHCKPNLSAQTES